MNRIALAAVLFVTLVGPVGAGFDKGVAAGERGDYATALKEFRPLAERDIARVQNDLGIMYDIGRGVPRDFIQAHMWYNLAVAQGFRQWTKYDI